MYVAALRLAPLALSLVGTTESDHHPGVAGVVAWMAACGGGAALLIVMRTPVARAASLGLDVGLLFADGDISAKLVGYGGLWLVALARSSSPTPSGRACCSRHTSGATR